jgi:hypothetical protein
LEFEGIDRHPGQERPGPTNSTIRPGTFHAMEFLTPPGRIVEIVGCVLKNPPITLPARIVEIVGCS